MIKVSPAWEIRPLGELVEILDALRIPVSARERTKRSGPIPYYGASGRVGWIDEALFNEPLVLLGEDGVLFFDSAKPKSYLVDGPAWVNNHAHVLRPKQVVNRKFLNYYLNIADYRGFANGTTRLKLTQAAMRKIPVPIPAMSEQVRIVDILEDHLSRIDAAKVGLVRARSRLDTLERSSLDEIFATDDGVPLADLVTDISAGKSFGEPSGPAAEGEWGIIKVSAMTWGDFRPTENKAIQKDRVDPRFEIREGDLLVSRANTSEYVGASVLVGSVRSKLLLSDKSLRVTPRDGVDREWLWRALQAPSARTQITALATGTKDSMRNIAQSSLRRVRIPDVGPEAQCAALRKFSELRDGLDKLRSTVTVQTHRSASLRRGLLAAAFSSQLTSTSSDMDRVEEMTAP